MPLTADEMIAALNSFEADSDYDQNQFRLYPITEGFKERPDRERVVPAMFALMERFPDEPLLIDSVRRQPAELNVWMVNRILNTDLPPHHRALLLDLMRTVPQHPKAPTRVAELARGFLEHQAKREPR